jgi:GMP synthase-like glutamine amidotransferase
MRILILETGTPPPALRPAYGDYPGMMRRMLAPALGSSGGRFSFFIARVFEGEAPPPVSSFDGLLITGSPAGVYEDHAFIAPAKALIRAAAAAGRPQVGICFGHQLMAEAFGGRVQRAEKGWGVGLHEYEVRATTPWMRPAASRIACIVSHQDQVVAAPAGARILAASDFCPFAALSYAEGPAISFQPHPEFDTNYARALLDLRRERFPASTYDAAKNSLNSPGDSALLARWIGNFFMEGGK